MPVKNNYYISKNKYYSEVDKAESKTPFAL